MSTHSYHAWLSLNVGNSSKQLLASLLIMPPCIKIGHEPPRTFDRENTVQDESRVTDFLCEIVRVVEIGGGKPLGPILWVAVLPVLQITLYDPYKSRIVEIARP